MAGRFYVFVLWSAMAAVAPSAVFSQCEDPQARCSSVIDAPCLRGRVGAGVLASASEEASAECRSQFTRYRECLAEVALACDPAGASADDAGGACAPDLEQRLWDTVKASNDPGELAIFVDTCPQSPFALIAKRRIAAAGAKPEAETDAAPQPAGAGGVDYRAAQTELRRLGFYRGGIDGDWGRGSQEAMRAFQRQAGMSEDGRLTEAGLAALKKAPTPATAAAPSQAQPGYVGAYAGRWRNPQLGASGRSEFLALSYDPATGALRGRMAFEVNGVVYQGVMTGSVTLARGGRLSGQTRAPDSRGWSTTLTLHPSSSFDVMTGAFHSTPLPGTFGVASSGVFETRRVQ